MMMQILYSLVKWQYLSAIIVVNTGGRTMYAVEFEATAHNGFIQIPEAFSEFASKHLKVVLMMENTQQESKIVHLQALVNDGLASGKSSRSMSKLKAVAQVQFLAQS